MIYFQSVTGQTISAQAYQGSTTVGASFSLAEIGATGLYFAAYPSLSAGEYLIAFNASGAVLGSGVLVWDGTGEIMTGYVAPANADIAAIKAKTDTLANGPSLAAIEGSTVLAKEATVTSRATQASVDALGSPAQASALAAMPVPLDSTQTQAAAAAALVAYDAVVPGDLSGLALEATSQAIKAKTDTITAAPTLAQIEASTVLAKQSGFAGLATAANVTSAQTAIIAEIDAIPTNPLLTTDARLSNLDAAISTRLASSGYTAPANSDIAAIKAKTDALIFTNAGAVDANIKYVNDVPVKGTGTDVDPWNPV